MYEEGESKCKNMIPPRTVWFGVIPNVPGIDQHGFILSPLGSKNIVWEVEREKGRGERIGEIQYGKPTSTFSPLLSLSTSLPPPSLSPPFLSLPPSLFLPLSSNSLVFLYWYAPKWHGTIQGSQYRHWNLYRWPIDMVRYRYRTIPTWGMMRHAGLDQHTNFFIFYFIWSQIIF